MKKLSRQELKNVMGGVTIETDEQGCIPFGQVCGFGSVNGGPYPQPYQVFGKCCTGECMGPHGHWPTCTTP